MYKKCILVCAGECIQSDMEELQKNNEGYIIAVDGGYGFCKMYDIEPDCAVGDFDSLDESLCQKIEKLEKQGKLEVIRLTPEKDDTDTLSAIKRALELGCKEFHYYCAMGGRIDHSIANIQTLFYLLKHGAHGYIHMAGGYFTAIENESIELLPRETGYISIFALNGDAKGVTLKNLKYELANDVIPCTYPIGCSNEFLQGKKAFIEVKDGSLLINVSL